MTQIGVAIVDVPVDYRYTQYVVTMLGSVDRDEDLHAMRELFALARTGTAVHEMPGRRPIGEDMDEDLRNTADLFFLGTNAYYVAGFAVKDMEDVEDEIKENDWGL